MICYRDMTFCQFKDCKNFETCGRAFTEKVQQEAIEWWGKNDPPVAFFVDKPDCFDKKEV